MDGSFRTVLVSGAARAACLPPPSCLLHLSPPSAASFIRLSQGHPEAPRLNIGLRDEAKHGPDALESSKLKAPKCNKVSLERGKDRCVWCLDL